jgi:hypothetical protein
MQNPLRMRSRRIDAKLIQMAKQKGHDGIITDAELVVFDPDQIRSAISG